MSAFGWHGQTDTYSGSGRMPVPIAVTPKREVGGTREVIRLEGAARALLVKTSRLEGAVRAPLVKTSRLEGAAREPLAKKTKRVARYSCPQ